MPDNRGGKTSLSSTGIDHGASNQKALFEAAGGASPSVAISSSSGGEDLTAEECLEILESQIRQARNTLGDAMGIKRSRGSGGGVENARGGGGHGKGLGGRGGLDDFASLSTKDAHTLRSREIAFVSVHNLIRRPQATCSGALTDRNLNHDRTGY